MTCLRFSWRLEYHSYSVTRGCNPHTSRTVGDCITLLLTLMTDLFSRFVSALCTEAFVWLASRESLTKRTSAKRRHSTLKYIYIYIPTHTISYIYTHITIYNFPPSISALFHKSSSAPPGNQNRDSLVSCSAQYLVPTCRLSTPPTLASIRPRVHPPETHRPKPSPISGFRVALNQPSTPTLA